MILESGGGVKSLIGCLHGISQIHKAKKQLQHQHNQSNTNNLNSENNTTINETIKTCPVPDGLPKTREEMEEEEKGKMPDSPFTTLLRSKGRFPAWYSPVPDNETQ